MTVGINKKRTIISVPAPGARGGFRSKAVEEIISGQPDFLSRFAILFFMLILTALFVASFFIKHVDSIYASALIVPVSEQATINTVDNQENPVATTSNNRFYACAMIKNVYLQKVKTGQQAILDFTVYPSKDFGTVTGYVESLSTIPGTNDYTMIKIKLPDGLGTSNNMRLPFLSGLNADIRINIQPVSLFDYFFNKK